MATVLLVGLFFVPRLLAFVAGFNRMVLVSFGKRGYRIVVPQESASRLYTRRLST
jgi:hypothetical protein